jgi:UDP-glucose 4-epimerase
MPGGRARVPAIAVADCAAVAVRAATAPPGAPDIPILSGGGHFEAIDVLDAGALDQAAHAAAIAAAGWPKRVVRLPAGLARAPARAAALAGLVVPGLVRRLPVPLRLESWDARFKPLRYATARLEDRLGWRPARPFAATLAALAAGRAAEDGPAP